MTTTEIIKKYDLAVITPGGRKGIYPNIKPTNVTDIEYIRANAQAIIDEIEASHTQWEERLYNRARSGGDGYASYATGGINSNW